MCKYEYTLEMLETDCPHYFKIIACFIEISDVLNFA